MSVVVITAPDPIIDLDLAKQHLKVTSDDDDMLIELYIDAAQSAIDGPRGWLGRCIGAQTLEFRLDGFTTPIWGWGFNDGGLFWGSDPSACNGGGTSGRIALPYPDLIEVSISHL